MKETIFGVLTIFLLVSCRYLSNNSDSPENQPLSFQPLLTTLVFILLEDEGVATIVQVEKDEHTAETNLEQREKKGRKTCCSL